jgi:hypothetical protein
MQMESDKITEVLKAKIAARKGFKKLEKGGSNPHFKSKYSTLDDIWNACGGALAENGLDVTHQILNNGNGTEIVATLFHESGQYLRSALPLPVGTCQQTGSAISYYRRYTIQSILGLEGDAFSDDDGNAAEQIINKITPKQKEIIVGLIKDANTDTETFCEHYGIKSVDDIPAERFAEVKKKMDGKVEAFNKINPDGKS